MRERFEILKSLLAEDGAIFVQLDDRETHYCKVLLDEVFGRSNYMNTIVVSTNKPFGFKGTSSGIFKQANHILFYAKDRQKLQLNERALYIEKGYDAQYKWVFDDTSVPESEWTWSPIGEAVAAELGYDRCSIPAHCIDPRRLPLFIARSALRDLISGLHADAKGVQAA